MPAGHVTGSVLAATGGATAGVVPIGAGGVAALADREAGALADAVCTSDVVGTLRSRGVVVGVALFELHAEPSENAISAIEERGAGVSGMRLSSRVVLAQRHSMPLRAGRGGPSRDRSFGVVPPQGAVSRFADEQVISAEY
jgi:hypothetical protein